jgi:hypothetical protein
MKKILIVLVIGLFCFGCSISDEFVKGIDGYSSVILPEYKDYVENDNTLSEDSKRIRKQTADSFQNLIDESKKEEK